MRRDQKGKRNYGKTVYSARSHRAGGGHSHRLRRVLQGRSCPDQDRRQSVGRYPGVHHHGRRHDHQRLHLWRRGTKPRGRGGSGGLRQCLLRQVVRLLCGLVHGRHLLPLSGVRAELAARPLLRRTHGLGRPCGRRPHHDVGRCFHGRYLHHERSGSQAGR